MRKAWASQEQGMSLRCLHMLAPRDRKLFGLAVVAQTGATILDLIGVLLFGAMGMLITAAATGQPIPPAMTPLIDKAGMSSIPIAQLALIAALGGALFLVLRSLIALFIVRRTTRFLAHRSAIASSQLAERFLGLPMLMVQRFSSQQTSYALTTGVNTAVLVVLSAVMTLIVEGALLVIMTVTLLAIDPRTTAMAVIYFGALALLMNKYLGGWSARAGRVTAQTYVDGIVAIQDAINTYREITVADRRSYYVDRFHDIRLDGSNAEGDRQFIVQIPRYAMETALLLGAGLLAASLLVTQSTEAAVGSLALFLAATSRVLPSLLRLNAARITLRGAAGNVDEVFAIEDLCDEQQSRDVHPPAQTRRVDLTTPSRNRGSTADPHEQILVKDLSVRYPGAPEHALTGVDLEIVKGSKVALVGSSGAGKTTLVDAILGVLRPSDGILLIEGEDPRQFVRNHPGAISYVPQDVALVAGTVRENVALAIPPSTIDDDSVWAALRRAHLDEYLLESRDGLETVVGERGFRLSGGQRQRLGLARALYSEPRILVLDEATSALDSETEKAVTDTLAGLSDHVTTITVAHRLATIQRADVIVYLEAGRLISQGSFGDVRAEVPRLERQAQLLGL